MRNSMASAKHLRLLTKNSSVGRILEGEPEHDSYSRLVPVKFVYVLVRMRYFLAVKYKHKFRDQSFSA